MTRDFIPREDAGSAEQPHNRRIGLDGRGVTG